MQEISVDQVLRLHGSIIGRAGGDSRMLSEGNLHQLVFRANLIPDAVARVALILYSLEAYPAFREGNPAIALALMEQTLAMDDLHVSHGKMDALQALIQGISTFSTEIEDIENWLRKNVEKSAGAD